MDFGGKNITNQIRGATAYAQPHFYLTTKNQLFMTATINKDTILTRSDIENLMVGDIVPNVLGKMRKITTIHHKGEDINGNLFACFYQELGENSTMSNSLKEGEKPNVLF